MGIIFSTYFDSPCIKYSLSEKLDIDINERKYQTKHIKKDKHIIVS